MGIYRFDYIGGPDTPDPDPQATPAGGRKVTFSVGTSGGVSYRWEFGDGGTSTSATTTRTYTAAGTYDVTLTVSYANGERASKTIQITVS